MFFLLLAPLQNIDLDLACMIVVTRSCSWSSLMRIPKRSSNEIFLFYKSFKVHWIIVG